MYFRVSACTNFENLSLLCQPCWYFRGFNVCMGLPKNSLNTLLGSDVKLYHYLIFFNENISDAVGKCGKILAIVIFNFHISFQNIKYVFVKTVQWGAPTWNIRMCMNSWLVYFCKAISLSVKVWNNSVPSGCSILLIQVLLFQSRSAYFH